MPWTLDGEFGGDHRYVEIENSHKALNLYLKSTKTKNDHKIKTEKHTESITKGDRDVRLRECNRTFRMRCIQ